MIPRNAKAPQWAGMLRIFIISGLMLVSVVCPAKYVPRDGDIIFQTSKSSQSVAVQKATHSPYSHMGIVFFSSDKPMVMEAVGPVKSTPLEEWIARGEKKKCVVKRLKDADTRLTTDTLKKMRDAANKLKGKSYDFYFEWSDERVYCSELVWKIYQRGAGIELGKLQKMRDFDLTSPEVKAKIKERFGGSIPRDEKVISPAAIFDSPLLEKVKTE